MKYVAILVLAIFASASAKAVMPKGFLDDLTAAVNQIYNDVLFPAINTQVQNISLLGAQLLAGISMSGLDGLTALLGKRENKGFFDDLLTSLQTSLYPVVDQAVSSLALVGAQLLAGVAMNGIGKRDTKGFLDDLTAAVNQIYTDVLFPAINTQVQNLSLLGAQLLAGISMSGLDGLTALLGKRELKGFFDDLLTSLTTALYPVVDQTVSSLALVGAQLLAGVAMNGIGKRDAKGITDFFTELGNQLVTALYPVVDQTVSSLALVGAQLLAGVAMNGIGKRELNRDFLDQITTAFMDVFNTVLFPAINTQVQNISLLGAQLLAGISMSGLDGITSLLG